MVDKGANPQLEETRVITSMMAEKRVFASPEELSKKAYVKSLDEYKEIYPGRCSVTPAQEEERTGSIRQGPASTRTLS